MVIKLMAHVLASSVRPKKLYFLAELILCFILEFFELFKGFLLMFHQIDISIPTQIISEGNEVLITNSSRRAHWSTYITVLVPTSRTPFRNSLQKVSWSFCLVGKIRMS